MPSRLSLQVSWSLPSGSSGNTAEAASAASSKSSFVNLSVECVLQCPAGELSVHDRQQQASGGTGSEHSDSQQHNSRSPLTTASLYLWIYSAAPTTTKAATTGTHQEEEEEGSEAVAAVLKRVMQRGPSAFLTETITTSITSCSVWTKCVCVLREGAVEFTRAANKSNAGGGLARTNSSSTSVLQRTSSCASASMLYDRRRCSSANAWAERSASVRRFAGTTQLTAAPARLARRSATFAVGLVAYHGPGNNVGNAMFVPVVVNESADSDGAAAQLQFGAMHSNDIFVQRDLRLFSLPTNRQAASPMNSMWGGDGSTLCDSSTGHPMPLIGVGEFASSVMAASRRHRMGNLGRLPTSLTPATSPSHASAALVGSPLEFSNRYFLLRNVVMHREHCDRLMEQFHVMVASSTTERRVCPTMVAQLHVPLELRGGMYTAKMQWFITALADAMILSSMMRQHSSHESKGSAVVHQSDLALGESAAANKSRVREALSSSTSSSLHGNTSKNALGHFLDPGAVINVLLRCCRDSKDLLASRFRGNLDESTIIAEFGAMNSGANSAAETQMPMVGGSPNAAHCSSSSPARNQRRRLSRNATSAVPSGADHNAPPPVVSSSPSFSVRSVSGGGGSASNDPIHLSPQNAAATHFSIEWPDFCLLATAGHEAWDRVLLPLVDRFYTFPPLLSKMRQCSSFRHATVEQVREHVVWVASALRPPQMRAEDFQSLLDRLFPPWVVFGTVGGGGGSRKSMTLQRGLSGSAEAGTTGSMTTEVGRGDRRALFTAATASSSTPPSWLKIFIKPSGRYVAKLGILAPREWTEELHVTPCRVIWALLPTHITNLVTDRSSRSAVYLSSHRRVSRHARIAQTYAASLAHTILHSLLHRYLHRWLVFYRQRRDFLRKRATLSASMVRKAENRLLGSYFHRWRQNTAAVPSGLQK